MKKRYSKRVREEAALICAIAASTPDLRQAYGSVYRNIHGEQAKSQYAYLPSFQLALAAWSECYHALSFNDNSGGEVDAEAEALIRTGWSPP